MMEVSKVKDKLPRSHNGMSTTTKQFLQKICQKETASVDMTQYGFLRDSKIFTLQLLIKPLLIQLRKIFDKVELNMPAKYLCKRVRIAENKKRSLVKKQKKLEKNSVFKSS